MIEPLDIPIGDVSLRNISCADRPIPFLDAKQVNPTENMIGKDILSADAALFVAQLLKAGGISKLARELGVSPASVSVKLSKLERRLGMTVVDRTSSTWRPTPEGLVIARAGESLESALASASSWSIDDTPKRTWVRVCAPTGLGRFAIGDILIDFARKFPDIGVSLRFENAVTDLIEKEVDLSIRVTDSPPNSMVAHQLFAIEHVLCAAPKLLMRHSAPLVPEDVEHLPFVGAAFVGNHGRIWGRHRQSDARVEVQVSPSLQVGEFNYVKQATLQGIGFSFLPMYLVQEELRLGTLREFLPEWDFRPYGQKIFLLRLRERYVSPAVMDLAKFIRTECARRMTSAALKIV
ncbi:LysR family transcriptional regulator [Cupriavidus necator]|nr:LysR family transcriptional regulator [Cupriavidus necator]QQX86617.1 LysR family transcriptional regulator [Cupriavidus necator]